MDIKMKPCFFTALLAAYISLAACGGGGGGGGGSSDGGSTPRSASVGGAVTGIENGSPLELQNNGNESVTIDSSGQFTFDTEVSQGAPYNITVTSQPPGMNCSVAYGSGTMGGAAVENVAVTCVPTPTTVDENGANTLSSTHKPTLVGVVIDSPVANLRYDGPSLLDGTTDDEGRFNYQPGEPITFKVGDVELPVVTGRPVITPFNFAGTNDLDDAVLVNVARFLQSLDSDGNPDNGITIPESAHTAATGESLDFASPAFNEDANPIIAAAGVANTSLIDGATAIAHLQQTLASQPKLIAIAGSWITGTGTNTRAVILLENGMYYGIEANCNGGPGYEYGSFAYSGNSLVLAVSDDDNGNCGLNTGTHTVTVTDTTLTLAGATWSDVSFATESVSGLYIQGEIGAPKDIEIDFVLFNGSQYVNLVYCDDENPANPIEIEFGTYTWNSITLAFNFVTGADRYPLCGPSDISSATTAENTGNSLKFVDDDGTVVLSAVRPARTKNTLAGYWEVSGGGANRAFRFPSIFTADGKYIDLENDDDGVECSSPSSSGEIGTYAWDAITGAFTYTFTSDSNGDCGHADLASGSGAQPDVELLMLVSGNLGTVYASDGETFVSVVRPTTPTLNQDRSGAVGLWTQTSGDGSLLLLITQSDTTTLTIRALDNDCPRTNTSYTVESLDAIISAPNNIVEAAAVSNVDTAACGLPTTLGPTYTVLGDTMTIDNVGTFIRQ